MLLGLSEESVRIAWLCALVLLAISSPAAFRRLRELGPAAWAPWLLVGVGAVTLRLMVEPGFATENRHGEMNYLRLVSGRSFDAIGVAWYETFRGALAVLPGGLFTLFAVNAVLGGLTAVLTGLFAVTVAGASRREGLLAAVLMAALPVHARISHSESLFVLAAFLSLSAATSLAAGITRDRPALIWAGFALAVVLAQVRPSFVFFPPLLLLLALAVASPPQRRLLASPHLLLGAAACAAMLLPRALILFFELTGPADAHPSPLFTFSLLGPRLVSDTHIVWNPLLFPATLTALALPGLLIVWARGPRRALWLLAFLCTYTAWFLSLQPNLGNIMRFQQSFLFVWVVLGAAGAVGICRLPRRTWPRRLVGVAVGLALAGGYLQSSSILFHRFDKDEELAFLRQAAQSLPSSGTLVIPAPRSIEPILAYFVPDLLPGGGRGWTVVRAEPGTSLGHLLETRDVFYYRGLWAYEFAAHELPPRDSPAADTSRNRFFDHERTSPGHAAWTASEDSMMRPEIAELEAGLVLEPLDYLPPLVFEPSPYHRWIIPQREITIGFFMVAGLAKRPDESMRPTSRGGAD